MIAASLSEVTPSARRCAAVQVVAGRQPRPAAERPLQSRHMPAELIGRCEACQRISAVRMRGELACASMVSRASVSASPASRSSTRRKCGDSAASSGKRRSSDWQNAWMVPMRMPPGRSSTFANSDRASRSACSVGSTCEGTQFVRQRRVVQRDPRAERLLQSHRHFGGGGLGEGQALDALGLRAGQHQPQQPIGQQLGLARSRRCADERRYTRVGCDQLFRIGAVTRRGPLPPTPSRKGRG